MKLNQTLLNFANNIIQNILPQIRAILFVNNLTNFVWCRKLSFKESTLQEIINKFSEPKKNWLASFTYKNHCNAFLYKILL